MTKYQGPVRINIVKLEDSDSLHDLFFRGQVEALKPMGLSFIVPKTISPIEKKNVHMLGVFENKEMIGGIKIHFKNPGYLLPAEKLLEKYPTTKLFFDKKLEKIQDLGVAELCSLWVKNSSRGRLLSVKIITEGIDYAAQLGYRVSFGLVGPASKSAIRAGCIEDNEIPSVNYPTEAYWSKIVWRFQNWDVAKKRGFLSE